MDNKRVDGLTTCMGYHNNKQKYICMDNKRVDGLTTCMGSEKSFRPGKRKRNEIVFILVRMKR